MPEVFDAINPESKQPVGIGCMNMSNEALYEVLDTLIGEMCDVFRSSPYFHIGSDEVTSGRLSLNPAYKAFMDKHGLKDDHELADHFVREVCAIVKKTRQESDQVGGPGELRHRGCDHHVLGSKQHFRHRSAEHAATRRSPARGTWPCRGKSGTCTRCNASQLKRSDSVLGATLVAWEQPPQAHVTNLRSLASRQERTWGPDNQVTVAGFAARFQPLDAVAGKLIDLPPKTSLEAEFSTPLGTRDFLEPSFALDGNDATFYQSADAPKAGDALDHHIRRAAVGICHRSDHWQ